MAATPPNWSPELQRVCVILLMTSAHEYLGRPEALFEMFLRDIRHNDIEVTASREALREWFESECARIVPWFANSPGHQKS